MVSVEEKFADALDRLIEQVKLDRSILAAILCGSLSRDRVWDKSDIDLVLVLSRRGNGRFYRIFGDLERGLMSASGMTTLLHFSEDPAIEVFVPRVAPTSIESEPFVWAVDEEHAPSYWFPRDCPRACCWTNETHPRKNQMAVLGLGSARRMHAIEACWLERLRQCRLFAYRFDPADFELKLGEAGYWVTRKEVRPQSMTPVGDLLLRHVRAQIELRIVANLWPLIDAIVDSGLEFSIIRKANTQPRIKPCA